MSFDPEEVGRYSFEDNCAGCCGCGVSETANGEYVDAEDFDRLKALLHDVSSEADPAGTLRELRLAQDTIRALEAENAELRKKLEQLKKDLDFQTEARVRDAYDNRANFIDWRKEHHDPLRYRVMDLEAEISRLKEERK